MKQIARLQALFLAIAIALLVINQTDFMALLLRQIVVGCCQLVLAIAFTFKYRRIPLLLKLYKGYWTAAIFSLATLILPGHREVVTFFEKSRYFLIYIVPWSTAVYFTVVLFISSNYTIKRYEK